MSTKEIKESIYHFYKLHKNTKIVLKDKYMFEITLGDTKLDLIFPIETRRELIINELLYGLVYEYKKN